MGELVWRDGVEVRQARPDEIGVLTELGTVIQRLHADGRPDVFRAPDRGALREFFEGQFEPGRYVLVAAAGGELIGYLVAEHIRRAANAFKHAASILYVHHIAVVAEARGTGVGSALMAAAAGIAPQVGASRLRLDSWQFNTEAHEFFAAQGFTPMNVVFERVLRSAP